MGARLAQWANSTRASATQLVGVKTFKDVHGLAVGLAINIRECRQGSLVSRAAQRLSGRLAKPSTPLCYISDPVTTKNPKNRSLIS